MLYTEKDIDFEQPIWKKLKPLVDSRHLSNLPQTVFFALKGKHRDGHEFVEELYQKGVRNFVISKQMQLPESQIWLVSDPLAVLQGWAAHHRKNFRAPLIAITGSNGKTIVKEWLYELLSPDFCIIKSPKSYNSQLGVPLSVLQAEDRHELAIFEAGISMPHEMQRLEAILQPDFGIFTNLGSAHSENFSSEAEKILQKLSLFVHCKKLVLSSKQSQVLSFAQTLNIPLLLWGFQSGDQIRIVEQISKAHSTILKLVENRQNFELVLPFADEPSIQNAMNCIAMMRLLGLSYEQIQPRVMNLVNLPMRLSIKDGGTCTLIDDSYNNDLQGLKLALDFLNLKSATQPKTLILSEMSGTEPEQVAALVATARLDGLYAVGKSFSSSPPLDFGCPTQVFESTEALRANLPELKGFVLIKGSRHFGFEKLVRAYESKIHATRLEINLSALAHNFRVFKGLVSHQTRLMAMVKAFAYGSGSVEVAKVLEYLGVDYLTVAFADEGIALRKAGIKVPIMVMSPQAEQFEVLEEYKLEPEVFNLRLLEKLIQKHPHLPFHLKLNTGMNRLGFDDAGALKPYLSAHPKLKIQSVFSHLAASGSAAHREFTLAQIERFQAELAHLDLPPNTLKHLANTEAIVNFPQATFDMVRLGIGLYGVSENESVRKFLKVVGTLKTTVIQLRTVPVGQSVGYNRDFVAQRPTQVAVLAIGYADGFDRRNGWGRGKVMIGDRLVSIIGAVCMDMSFADVTGLEVYEGQEVMVFGESPTVEEVAKTWQTIPYEVLTHVNERVKRIFYED
jgi:alanine racemase